MISLKFTQNSSFSVASIPERWRKYVTVRKRLSTSDTTIFEVSIDIAAEDSSYRYRALMQKPQLVLKFSLPFFVEFPVGTTCIFQNQRFILTKPENLKKQCSRNIEYSMTLGTNEDFMSVWKFRNTVDRRLKFSMCAKPHEFIEEIVKNLNRKDTSLTWQVGECIEATEKTVEFNHAYIDAALTDICNIFETEYEVEYVGTTVAKIHLRKVEYFKDSPVALSYGRGNGFVPGVGRSSETGGEPVKRLYVQGTDRNIDRSKYGSPELLLPKNQTLEYESRTYRASKDGTYIERIDKISSAIKEDSLDCSEIYPSRVGTVTSVVAVKPEKNLYDIIDNTIPSTLNFNNYLIAGENMTIIFQSGMLAGKEFDIKYKHDERRFEIVPQEIDGVTMPNETYKPNADSANPDRYAIFGCMLPDDYICNNTEKTGASWDMFREAAKALYECEDQKFTFTGQLQALWTKRNWLAVGGHLVVGGYVLFTDNQFAIDGVKIRITGIKDYINKPYAPTIELSNSVSGASVSSQLRQIENTEVVIDDTKHDIIEFTKRRFRDAKETIEMLEDAMLDNFTNSISPISVQTMAMLVGDESLQFQFVGIDSSGNQVVRGGNLVGYNQEKKQLFFVTPSAGMDIYLKHLTLGINTISSSHKDTEYKKWKMKPYTSPVLTDGSKRYYLYAKCYTDENLGGELVLSENAIKMEEVSNCYHFLVGVLNSESEGERSFVSLYGFTEILPGRITTESITSSDGKSCFDMKNNTMHIGNEQTYFDWNLLIKNVLSIRNASIRIDNSKGDTSVLFDSEDGHGVLACGNIEWDEFGNVHIKGAFSQSIIPIEESDASAIEMIDNQVLKYKLNKHLYLLTCGRMYYDNSGEEQSRYSYYNHFIVLPEDISYSGKVVRIYNANFGPYSRTPESFASTTIMVENGNEIVGIPPIYATTYSDAGGWDSIRIMGGYAEFVGLPDKKLDANNNLIDVTKWICIQYSGVGVYGTHNGETYVLSHQFSNAE